MLCSIGLAAVCACGRLGFSNEPLVMNHSTIAVSAPLVTTCNRLVVTLTSRDPDETVLTSGGAQVELALGNGTSAGELSPVIDHGDGTYSAMFTGTGAGTPTAVAAMVDGDPVIETASIQVDDERSPTNGLLFMLDAARATGGACTAPAGSGWTDTVAQVQGTFLGIADPTCTGAEGWCGNGLVDDPFRLALDGIDDLVDFGTVVATGTFTVTTWVRPRPGGVLTTTGTGGINLKPIVSKGAADVEVVDKDTNYVIGMMAAGVVGTDLERTPDSQNLPMTGTVPVAHDAWHQLAVTYDQIVRRIYLDGSVDSETAMSNVPSSAINSRRCVGAARRVTLEIEGQFQGDVALVQVYDHALTQAEMADACRSQARRFTGAVCP
jgi:hypothetical protein